MKFRVILYSFNYKGETIEKGVYFSFSNEKHALTKITGLNIKANESILRFIIYRSAA